MNIGKVKINNWIKDFSIDDCDLIRHFLGSDFIPPKRINSPFRATADSKSFSITKKDGKVFWHDFVTGESGGLLTLVCRLYNLTPLEVVQQMQKEADTIVDLDKQHIKEEVDKVKDVKERKKFTPKTRHWDEWDTEYWGKYGLTQADVKRAHIYPLDSITIDDSKTIQYKDRAYLYDFINNSQNEEEYGEKPIYKCYCPYGKMKWLSNIDNNVYELNVNKATETCFITSSRKDNIVLFKHIGSTSLSFQSENMYPSKEVMTELLSFLPNMLVILYDNDEAGYKGAEKLANYIQELDSSKLVYRIFLPKELGCKDPSDFVAKYGAKALQECVKNLVCEAIKKEGLPIGFRHE